MSRRLGKSSKAFTLVEVILALAITGLLTLAVFAIVTASMRSADQLAHESLREQRIDALVRVLRMAFASLPPEAVVYLSKPTEETSQLVVLNDSRDLLLGSEEDLRGGWILATRHRSDGSSTLSLFSLPPRVVEEGVSQILEGAASEEDWLPLLPGVADLQWRFRTPGSEDWQDVWETGQGRPQIVSLRMTFVDGALPVEFLFWIPELSAPTTVSSSPRTRSHVAPQPVPPAASAPSGGNL